MKKLLILVCSLAIGSAAFAAPAKGAPKSAHLSGTIAGYDAAAHTLTVRHDGKDSTFTVSDKAQVMQGKSKADVSSLSASIGHTVKLDYMVSGATRTAEKIDVSAAAAAARMPAARKK